MRRSIGEAIASRNLLATGGLAKRATSAARIIKKGEAITIEDPPSGEGWMSGGGYALTEYASKEEAIEDCKRKLGVMGDGVMELIQVGEIYPRPKAQQLPGVIAYFAVDGAAQASEFYAKAFGAREVRRQPAEDGKRLMHCQVEINGGTLMFCDGFPEYGQPVRTEGSYTMQLVVEDGQTWWDRAIAAGCTQTMPFELAFWGDRYGKMKDPFGIEWAISSPVTR
jgi:uncharacterized glyoxalase superfamily protein PhnB